MILFVVGCGTVGSALLKLIALKSTEFDLPYKSIVLIDPDLEKVDNIFYPKVYSIFDYMKSLNCALDIYTYLAPFPDCMDIISKVHDVSNGIFLDCRDTEDSHATFMYKINSDGPYGKIVKYPKTQSGLPQNYMISNSKYYSLLTVSTVVEDILNIKEVTSFQDKETEVYICNHLM